MPTEDTEKKAENDQGPHAKAAEDAKLGRGFWSEPFKLLREWRE